MTQWIRTLVKQAWRLASKSKTGGQRLADQRSQPAAKPIWKGNLLVQWEMLSKGLTVSTCIATRYTIKYVLLTDLSCRNRRYSCPVHCSLYYTLLKTPQNMPLWLLIDLGLLWDHKILPFWFLYICSKTHWKHLVFGEVG